MSPPSIYKIFLLGAIPLVSFYAHSGPGMYQGLPLANPHLAILPVDSQPNYDHWLQNPSSTTGAFTRSQPLNSRTITQVDDIINEQESRTFFGENDAKENAQSLIIDYSQLTGLYGALTVHEQSQTFTKSQYHDLEENDTASSAAALDMSTAGVKHQVEGSLIDGLESFRGQDFDIFRLNNLNPHLPIYIEYSASQYSDAILSFSDQSLENFIDYTPEFYSVLPFSNHFQSDLYVAIGPETLESKDDFEILSGRSGSSTLDNYNATFYQPEMDVDHYSIILNEGDLLSVSSNYSNVLLQIESPLGQFVAGYSSIGFIYPSDSPAIKTGASNIAYTATHSGVHTIIVKSIEPPRQSTDYEILIQREKASSSLLNEGESQVVFLDFDGATLNGLPFNGINEDITLSGLSQFLDSFGLQANDEAVLTQEIIKVFTTHFDNLLNTFSDGSTPELIILNSMEDADAFGSKNVSRIIIGGTIEELKLATIGIAQSLDPGNFKKEETGIVLLDLLSSEDNEANSLNFLSRDQSISKINLVASAVGTIAAHELGHILSGFHTDNSNDTYNIMDAGGNNSNRLGIGEDGIFGTSDDEAILFQKDDYDPSLNYFGEQDTPNQIAQGLRINSQSNSSGGSDGFLGLGGTSFWLLGLISLMLLRIKENQVCALYN